MAKPTYVPVYTRCVRDVPVASAYEFDKLPLAAPAGEKILALSRDWPVGRKYEGQLEAELASCI